MQILNIFFRDVTRTRYLSFAWKIYIRRVKKCWEFLSVDWFERIHTRKASGKVFVVTVAFLSSFCDSHGTVKKVYIFSRLFAEWIFHFPLLLFHFHLSLSRLLFCKDSSCSASIYFHSIHMEIQTAERRRERCGVIRQSEEKRIYRSQSSLLTSRRLQRSYQWDVRFTSRHEGKRIRHLVPLIVETPTQHLLDGTQCWSLGTFQSSSLFLLLCAHHRKKLNFVYYTSTERDKKLLDSSFHYHAISLPMHRRANSNECELSKTSTTPASSSSIALFSALSALPLDAIMEICVTQTTLAGRERDELFLLPFFTL